MVDSSFALRVWRCKFCFCLRALGFPAHELSVSERNTYITGFIVSQVMSHSMEPSILRTLTATTDIWTTWYEHCSVKIQCARS